MFYLRSKTHATLPSNGMRVTEDAHGCDSIRLSLCLGSAKQRLGKISSLICRCIDVRATSNELFQGPDRLDLVCDDSAFHIWRSERTRVCG